MDDAESESVCFLIGRYVQNDSSLKPNRRVWYIELNGGYPGFCCGIVIVSVLRPWQPVVFPIAIIECLPPPSKHGCQTRNFLCPPKLLSRRMERNSLVVLQAVFNTNCCPADNKSYGILCRCCTDAKTWFRVLAAINAEDKVGVHYQSGKCQSGGCNMVTL